MSTLKERASDNKMQDAGNIDNPSIGSLMDLAIFYRLEAHEMELEKKLNGIEITLKV